MCQTYRMAFEGEARENLFAVLGRKSMPYQARGA
jgi:hypothetical protein